MNGNHPLSTGWLISNHALVCHRQVLDDAEYGLSALKVDVKGAVMSLFT